MIELSKFYFHWEKQNDKMIVHHRSEVYNVKDVFCKAECLTKRNKEHPHLVLEGFAKEVTVRNDTAFIK